MAPLPKARSVIPARDDISPLIRTVIRNGQRPFPTTQGFAAIRRPAKCP